MFLWFLRFAAFFSWGPPALQTQVLRFFHADNTVTTCIREEASLDTQEAKEKIQQVQIQIGL